jgi:hypothetical protein
MSVTTKQRRQIATIIDRMLTIERQLTAMRNRKVRVYLKLAIARSCVSQAYDALVALEKEVLNES